MKARPVALVCGHATLDRLDGRLVPGGSVYYAAHALAALGAEVRVATAGGSDLPASAFQLGPGPGPGLGPDQVQVGTLSALVLRAPATTVFENAYGPDGRRTQRVLSTAPPLDPAHVPAAWRAPDLLLLAPVLGELDPGAFVRTVRARHVGLCVQGLVRAVRADGSVAPLRFEPGAGALAGIEAAFVGDDEAAEQPDLVARLAAVVAVVAFTHGARGCEVIVRGGAARRVGVHPAREVEPTGAGDVFAAAFLLALTRGDAPEDAARLGAAAASIVIEGRGGEALPRVGEAWDRIGRVPVE